MARDHTYFVYLLASGKYGTLYIGVTNDLLRRVGEHRDGTAGAFTRKYRVKQLMWFEVHHDVNVAIQREKSMKTWPRAWKTNLIERENPHWQDFYPKLVGDAGNGVSLSGISPSCTMGPAHEGQDDRRGCGAARDCASSPRDEHPTVNKISTTGPRRLVDGRWHDDTGPLPDFPLDWDPPMTDAEIAIAAAADPDARPVDKPFGPNARRVGFARVVRRRLDLSHAEFEARYRVPADTLLAWERGTVTPDAMAEAYCKLIAADPTGVAATVAAAGVPIAAE